MRHAAVQKRSLAACLKAGLAIQGFAAGGPVLPQRQLRFPAKSEIRQMLEGIGAL